MGDIVVNKIRRLPQITEAELTTILKTIKEEQFVSLKKIFQMLLQQRHSYFCCLSFFDDCHQSR